MKHAVFISTPPLSPTPRLETWKRDVVLVLEGTLGIYKFYKSCMGTN